MTTRIHKKFEINDEYQAIRRESENGPAFPMRMKVIEVTSRSCTLQSIYNPKYRVSGRILTITSPSMQTLIISGFDAIFSCNVKETAE